MKQQHIVLRVAHSMTGDPCAGPGFAPTAEAKTKGRVIRADQNLPEDKPDALSEADWQSFRGNYRETELWMEFTVN